MISLLKLAFQSLMTLLQRMNESGSILPCDWSDFIFLNSSKR